MAGTVGIVGLGIMGGAIARNLVERGWQVLGCDPDPSRQREAIAAGVQLVANPAALAMQASTILLSLPSPAIVHDVATAIASSGAKRCVVIEVSTLSLTDKQKASDILAKAGHILLDCPISGTGAQAQVRDLVLYASGDSAEIAAQTPMLLDFSRAVHDVGGFGNGTKMKFVANLLVAIHNVASAEAMVLGMKAGLDPQQINDLIAAGAGTSRVFELRAPMMVANSYLPATMKVSTWQKDMAIITGYAAELGCPVPLLNATMPVYASAMANGHAAEDTAAVCAVLEQMAGINRD